VVGKEALEVVPTVAAATLSVTSVGSLVISPATAPAEHRARVMVAVVLVGGMVGGGHSQTKPASHVVDMVTCHGTAHKARSVTTVEKLAT